MKQGIAHRFVLVFTSLILALPSLASGQDQARIEVTPSELAMEVGETKQLTTTIYNARGETIPDTVIYYSRALESVSVSSDGTVTATRPGRYEVVAVGIRSSARTTIPVTIAYPPLKTILFQDMPVKIYAQTVIPVTYTVTDTRGQVRNDVEVNVTSSDKTVAEIGPFGRLHAKKAGTFTLRARAKGITATWNGNVRPNPVRTVDLSTDATEVRTGDVVYLDARALNARGNRVPDAPITYAFVSDTDDDLGEAASGQIEQDGRFVANKPGLFTLVAKSGNAVAEQTIRVNSRNVRRDLEVIGHGKVLDKHTSDLWVWEGVDGRDYAVTGTWGAAGEAYFWDVTDPSAMHIIDTVTVDARTVNDVKVSEDGRLCILTREGASDRKNGIVILDVTDPAHVKKISEYSRGLTGGVHNAFIWNDHVFAVNNGRRYDIINIEDPEHPKTVGRFELDTPGHAVHDVWIENGIAYSSNWDDGVVMVDVGSTPQAETPEKHAVGAGSPENPVKLGSYAYPSGWNHAAFPFKSRSTGDFYVVAGDEAFPNGINLTDKPTVPAGWIHFIKFEEGWDSPREVARYQVPEAGTHNLWIRGDTLYVAYYNAGLRIVDISGELMGNLYDQGREIARFLPKHHQAIVPNASMTWGPQPHKGYVFVSDWNSGLWSFKLKESAASDTR